MRGSEQFESITIHHAVISCHSLLIWRPVCRLALGLDTWMRIVFCTMLFWKRREFFVTQIL